VTKYQKPKTSTDISSKPLSYFFICTLLNGYLSFFLQAAASYSRKT